MLEVFYAKAPAVKLPTMKKNGNNLLIHTLLITEIIVQPHYKVTYRH